MTWVRLYEKPNCEVTYHQTNVKDFQRVVCGPELLPGEQNSCMAGKFLSYRIEENPMNPNLPKLDKLVSDIERKERESSLCSFLKTMTLTFISSLN